MYQGQKQQGTGFQNVQNLIDKNKGSVLGKVVGQKVKGVGEQAQAGLQQAQTGFQQGIAGEQTKLDQGKTLTNTINANATAEGGVGAVVGEGSADVAKNVWGGYKGPNELQNQQNLMMRSGRATGMAQDTQTQTGRGSLLRQIIARPGQQYTQGQQKLDTLVMGQDQGAMKQAYQAGKGVLAQTLNASRAAQAQAGGLRSQNQALQAELGGAISKADEEMGKALESTLESRRTEADVTTNELINRLNDNTFTQGDLDKVASMGIDVNAIGLRPKDIAKLISSNSGKFTDPSQFATAEQLASYKALSSLAKDPSQLKGIVDESKIGQDTNLANLNKDEYKKYIEDRAATKESYNKINKNITDNMRSKSAAEAVDKAIREAIKNTQGGELSATNSAVHNAKIKVGQQELARLKESGASPEIIKQFEDYLKDPNGSMSYLANEKTGVIGNLSAEQQALYEDQYGGEGGTGFASLNQLLKGRK
jgi:hypothetical protein